MSDSENFNFSLNADSPTAEIINYFKKKLKDKVLEYEAELKHKNETIEKLNDQIRSLEEMIEQLKSRYSQTENEILTQNKELFVKMEESKQILIKQKEKHQKEISLLKDIFERTKMEISQFSAEIDELKKERNRIKEELLLVKSQKSDIEDKMKMLENQLSSSKKAVEETLSELFEERKKVSELSKKITEGEKEKEELKKQLESTKLAWDNERAQWKEMWERERSLWESHRMEFAVWEERLRNEREAWIKKLKEEEEKGVEYAKDLSKVLEDASKWSYKVGELLKLYAKDGVRLPQVFVSQKTLEKKAKSTTKKIFAMFLIGALLLGLIAYTAIDYKSKLHLAKYTSFTLDDSNYTGFVKSGDVFFFSHWSGGVVLKDAEMKNISKISEFDGSKLKISAIAEDGEYLWLLDMSGLRFIKVDPYTGKIVKSFKTLGVAPQGVACDGFYLWSFDASAGLLYRYDINDEIKGVSSYSLEGIKNVNWLGWVDGILYVVSNDKLYRFSYNNDRFKKISVQNAKNFVYCYVYKDKMYVLKDNGNIKEFDIYKIKI
ncbi:MAG: hypothetical protein K6357_04735 [Elusimicrobiota bacterium]